MISIERGLPYPYTTFLFIAEDRFADFFKSIDLLQVIQTWDGTDPLDPKLGKLAGRPFVNVYNYFLANLIYYAGNKHIVLILFFIVILVAFVWICKKNGNSARVIVLAMLSYPMIFVLDRGNFALLVFVLLLISISIDNIIISTLLIAICTSLRFTPVIFIVPLLLRSPITIRRIANIVSFLLLWVLLINDFSIWYIRNTISKELYDPAAFLAKEIDRYNKAYIIEWDGLPFDSSMFLPFKWIVVRLAERVHFLNRIVDAIQPVSIVIGTCAFVGAWFVIKGSVIKQFLTLLDYKKVVSLVCISFVLFMPITGDYYLLVLFIPLILFPSNSYSFLYCLCYALLIAPKNLYFIGAINVIHHISLQVFINPLLLLLLFFAELNLLPFARANISDPIPLTLTKG